jgi:hypothetical protein
MDEMKELAKQFLDDATQAEISKIARADSPAMQKEEQIKILIKEKLPRLQDLLLGKILLRIFI